MKKRFMPNVNKPRFIVVDVCEITRNGYYEKNELKEVPNVLEIFDEKNIPKKFQKLVIYVKPLFRLDCAYDYCEYTIGFPFYLDIINDEVDKEKKFIVGKSIPTNIYENLRVYNRIKFKTSFQVYSEEAINTFFKEMNDSGYLELYLECIKDMFWKISFNEIVNSYKETKKKILEK